MCYVFLRGEKNLPINNNRPNLLMKPVTVLNNMVKGLKNNLVLYFLTVNVVCFYIVHAKNCGSF